MSTKSKSVATIFGIQAPARVEIESFGPGSNIEIDNTYVFGEWIVKLLLLWWSGSVTTKMYLFGATGTGKSSVFEQFGAVMGVPVFRVGFHNRLEYSEALGSVQLFTASPEVDEDVVQEKGMLAMLGKMVKALRRLSDNAVSTKFVHAELGQAMVTSQSHKVIVLLDEVDQGHPSQNMAWNKLLDGCPLVLPTGQTISTENVWIAATGNTRFEDDRGLYRGTQKQNIAFMSRFGIHEEITYPDAATELAILQKVAPALTDDTRTTMVTFAGEMRNLFVNCDLDVPLATRTLINWSKMTCALNGMPGISPLDKALSLTYMNQCSADDAAKVSGAWQRVTGVGTSKAAGTP